VLHENHGGREIAREAWSQAHDRRWSTRGSGKHNDWKFLIVLRR
jgi:hypothetical protein